ncbi:MAG TPA: hypothetical protein VL027_08685 [Spongiibacteraceae bacterium]|nr:hypothetical protein [Spongiibacteraceae bacterium]HUH38006.1 hypothetical protein [Spongiibacteraceae bacterium]
MPDIGADARATAGARGSDDSQREAPQPAVERIRALRQLDSLHRNVDDAGLSRHARKALSTYLANSPSIAERLGIELAGIDETA